MIESRAICFLLLPKVHLLDFGGPAQVFHEANALAPGAYEPVYASRSGVLDTAEGIAFGSLLPPEKVHLRKGDFIVVPGIDFQSFCDGKLIAEIRAIAPWLRESFRKGVKLASVCTGSLVLAEAGLLRRKKCTTHWRCIAYMAEQYPQAQVQTDRLFVYDDGIYTSAGMASGIDLALSLVEEHHGPVLSSRIAREIVVHMRRSGTDSQESMYLDYRTHFNPAVHIVQDFIISHPERNPGLQELAELVHMSVRSLTRIFKSATGHTLVEFKNLVKLRMAKNLMNNPGYTMEGVAALSGFGSARHMRRVWKMESKVM